MWASERLQSPLPSLRIRPTNSACLTNFVVWLRATCIRFGQVGLTRYFSVLGLIPKQYQSTQANLSKLAAALSTEDAGALCWVTDYGHLLAWTGSGWQWGPGEQGSGMLQPFAVAPGGPGWHLCDGAAAVKYLKSDGTTGTVDLPDISTGSYAKLGPAYSKTVTPAQAPTISQPTFAGSPLAAHQHLVPFVAGGGTLYALPGYGVGSGVTANNAIAMGAGGQTGVTPDLTSAVTAGTPSGTVSQPHGHLTRRPGSKLSGSSLLQAITMSLFGDVLGYINSGRAAKSVSDANIAAEHGILDATQNATTAIETQLGKAYNDVGQAGVNVTSAADRANQGLDTALGNANGSLQSLLAGINGAVQPYMAGGQQGEKQLMDYAASNPQFSFNLNDYLNSPAMKFEMDQGTNAITNSLAAQGIGGSGKALTDLTTYGQGLAAKYYGQAFDQAQQQFQTNQNTTLANLTALINSGLQGTSLYSAANQNLGERMSSNTLNTSQVQGANTISAANTNASLQQFLASLGLQGQEAAGRESMQGALDAGNYAVGAGQAHAQGIMNQGASLVSGINDLASMISPLVGSIPLPGGGATTVSGMIGG